MTLYEDMLKNINEIYKHVGCDFPAGTLLGNLEMNWILTSGDTLYYGEEKDQIDEFFFKYTLYSDITTLEISIDRADVDYIIDHINNNLAIELPKGYVWVAYECKTCREYHKDNDLVHLSIESLDFVEKFIKTPSKISRSWG